MKTRTLACITAMTLFGALAICIPLRGKGRRRIPSVTKVIPTGSSYDYSGHSRLLGGAAGS